MSCREKPYRDTRGAPYLCPVCRVHVWSRVGLGVSLLCVVSARERQRERRGETGESMHHSRARNSPQPTYSGHTVCVCSLQAPSPYRSVWSPRAHPYRVLSWVLGDVSPSLLRKLTFAKTETLEQTSARPAGSAIVDPAQSLRYHPARAASPRCVGRRGAGASAV